MRILVEVHVVCLTLIIATVNCRIFKQCQGIENKVYIAGQSGCRSFIFCNGESSYESSCPRDSAFNPLDGTCDDPANVDCHDEPEEPISAESNIVCPSADEIVFLSSPDSCENYYMCYSGTPIALTCSNHLHFNAQSQSCDFPTAANCKLPNTASTNSVNTPPTPPMTTITTSQSSTIITSPQPNGLSKPTPPLPAPTTLATPRTVPTTTAASSRPTPTQQSTTTPRPTTTPQPTPTTPRPPTTPQPTPTTPRPTTTPQPTPTTTTRTDIGPPTPAPTAEELCKQHWVGNFPFPEDCHYYYRCMNGLLSKQECPSGFGWDINKKLCTTSGCHTAKE